MLINNSASTKLKNEETGTIIYSYIGIQYYYW